MNVVTADEWRQAAVTLTEAGLPASARTATLIAAALDAGGGPLDALNTLSVATRQYAPTDGSTADSDPKGTS